MPHLRDKNRHSWDLFPCWEAQQPRSRHSKPKSVWRFYWIFRLNLAHTKQHPFSKYRTVTIQEARKIFIMRMLWIKITFGTTAFVCLAYHGGPSGKWWQFFCLFFSFDFISKREFSSGWLMWRSERKVYKKCHLNPAIGPGYVGVVRKFPVVIIDCGRNRMMGPVYDVPPLISVKKNLPQWGQHLRKG